MGKPSHRVNLVKGFTRKYRVHNLVYFEGPMDINFAIAREKALKFWKRQWKIRIIEEGNSKWEDLYARILPGSIGPWPSPGRHKTGDKDVCIS